MFRAPAVVFIYGSSSHRSSLDDGVVSAVWITEAQIHSLVVLARKVVKSWDALDFCPADERWVLKQNVEVELALVIQSIAQLCWKDFYQSCS